ARRPCPSSTLALRSLLWLMIADDAQRPRCVATSKQIVSIAPRTIAAVLGSIGAAVASGGRRATRRRFVSYDMGNSRCVSARFYVSSDREPREIGRKASVRMGAMQVDRRALLLGLR